MAIARTTKRTYTLRQETIARFESLVPPGKRSQLVDDLLQKEAEAIQKAHLRALIDEGLQASTKDQATLTAEWSATEADAWPTE